MGSMMTNASVTPFPVPPGIQVLKTNAFCPTGKGGGVDPTCSPGKSIPDASKQTYYVSWTPHQYDPIVAVSIKGEEESLKLSTGRTPLNVQVITEKAMTYKQMQSFLDDLADREFRNKETSSILYGEGVDPKRITTNSSPTITSLTATDSNGNEFSLPKSAITNELVQSLTTNATVRPNPLLMDPTGTGKERKALEKAIMSRLKMLKQAIVETIVTEDVFGLKDKPSVYTSNLASTQVDITDPKILAAILDIQNRIDPADLVEFEDKSHITIRYGLHDLDSERVEWIVSQYSSVRVKLGGLSIFPAKEPDSQRGGPEYDVLKIDVSSKDLESINRHLGILPNTTTHPDYHPHLTIAYLKPGTGHKYVGESGLEGVELEFKSMVYSDDDRKKTEIVFNAFCPTGEGGGVDPSCSPNEPSSLVYGVKALARMLKEEWHYHGEVEVLDAVGEEFERGGLRWRKGGECFLANGQITMYGQSAGTEVGDVERLLAHEFMHGTYEKVYQGYLEEQRVIASLPDPSSVIRMSGELRPEFAKEYPTYNKMWKFEEANSHRLKEEDGVTEYSKAYWKDFEQGKVSFHIAVHETLAEIAGMHQKDGVIEGSKLYRDYYKAVRDEYQVLTGSKKRSRKEFVSNEQQSHEMYLDENFVPTTKDKSVWLQVWEEGSVITARRESVVELVSPTTNAGIWEFVTDDQKVEEFIKWIRSQMSVAVLGTMTTLGTTDPDHWLMKHIQDTYTKGMGKVFEFLRKPIFAEKMPHYEGTKAEFLKSAFTRPVSPNRVKLLAGRAYSELSGMTDKMATQMQRSLTDGFIRGESPRDIARQLVKDVDGLGRKQANMIASTEITRAYNEGQLDSMEELGVEDVGVSVEWRVSKQGVTVLGNPSPCPVCAPLNGIVLKISEARGLLPRHPHCRCSWTPSGVGESTKGQKRSQQRIVQAVKSSLLAERPKRKKTAAKPSRWAGSKAKIGKNRPKSILD